jgi:hypothetical protein
MRKNHLIYTGLVILNILIISIFIIEFSGSTYPKVGNDYQLFGPRLLDSLLFYKVNGFAIEWYTPSFGGGLPAYPNPLQMQFSFQQLFTFIFNPWIAILATTVLYIAIGFVVCYLFLRDILDLMPLSSILGANFFVGCGFFIERVLVGHADKITYPLIIVPIYALLNHKFPSWLSGIFIALTGAILLNSGGVYIGVMCLFTVLVTLPLLYFLKPALFVWKRFAYVASWGILLTILLCGSKLYPAASYMSNFPRTIEDHYYVSLSSSIGGAIFQMFSVMNFLPFLKLIGKSSLVLVVRLAKLTGSPYGFWEMDSSISPSLMLLLFYGVWLTLRHKPQIDKNNLIRKGIAGICLILSVVLVFQFSAARGFLFEHIRALPVFESLRTNTRFISSYVFPLSILGAKVFDVGVIGRSTRRTVTGFAMLNCLSLVALWAYYLLPANVQYKDFDITLVIDTYKKIEAGAKFPVNRIIPAMNDYEVFTAGASNVTHHYDPLLGENSFQPRVHEGSVFEISDGFYNLTDPTGYVFPSENNSKLFSLIPVTETRQLEDFVNRRQPDWKLPLIQILLDWVSGITFVLMFLASTLYPLGMRIRKSRTFCLPPFSGHQSS